MSKDNVEHLLANALRNLVDYVDRREETFTADDDVRALEDVAAVLQGVASEDLDRVRALLGSKLSLEVGLSER